MNGVLHSYFILQQQLLVGVRSNNQSITLPYVTGRQGNDEERREISG